MNAGLCRGRSLWEDLLFPLLAKFLSGKAPLYSSPLSAWLVRKLLSLQLRVSVSLTAAFCQRGCLLRAASRELCSPPGAPDHHHFIAPWELAQPASREAVRNRQTLISRARHFSCKVEPGFFRTKSKASSQTFLRQTCQAGESPL